MHMGYTKKRQNTLNSGTTLIRFTRRDMNTGDRALVGTVCRGHGHRTIVVGILEFKVTDLRSTPVTNTTLVTLLDCFELEFSPVNKDT